MTDSQPADGRDEVEVAHEALIRHWPRLRTWLDEDRGALLLRESLREAAHEWEQHGRDESYLAHRGRRLAEAEALAHHPRFSLNVQERAYLDAAIALREREAQEREAQGQRELAAQRERTELAEQRAAEQVEAARKLRRRLMIAVGLGTLALLAAIGALWGFRQAGEQQAVAEAQRSRAEEQARIALSRQLAAQALSHVDDQLDLALLLSLEANRAADVGQPEVRGSLLAGLTSSPYLSGFLRGHTDRVRGLAFSPDGTILASGSSDGTVRLWDVATSRLRTAPLVGHDRAVQSVAFSPDGQTVASASCGTFVESCTEGEIRLLDVVTGEARGEPLAGHAHWVYEVAFSPDGLTLASGGGDGTVIFWDAVTGQARGQPLTGHEGIIPALAFSPDGTTLASGGTDGTIILWDVATGKPHNQPLASLDREVDALAFSPDGRTLALGGQAGDAGEEIILWDVATGQPQGEPLADHRNTVFSVAFSPDGATLASSSTDRQVIVWDLDTRTPRQPPLSGHMDAVFSLAFSPDGNTLAAGSDNGTIVLWNSSPIQGLAWSLAGEYDEVGEVAFSPDGGTIASASEDGTVRLWDVASGQLNGPPTAAHEAGPITIAFSPDGATVASGGFEGTVRLWDAVTGQARGQPLTGHEAFALGLAFSPDGSTLASGGCGKLGEDDLCIEGEIRLWDAVTGAPRGQPLVSHDDYIYSLAFSPDGETIASGSGDEAILLRAADGTQRFQPLVGQGNPVLSVAFSPDGKTLASSGINGIIVWNVATGAQQGQALTEHQGPVLSVAISPDGQVLASGGGDGVVMLWDLRTLQPMGPLLSAYTDRVTSVAFSADGKQLVAGGEGDNPLVVWDLDGGSWQSRACALAGRNLAHEEWQQYLGDEPYRPTCAVGVLKEADSYALVGAMDEAEPRFAQAVQLAVATDDPFVNNQICWFGSLHGFAEIVLPACERAVEVAPESEKSFYHDTRGLGRALTGNYSGAAQDFGSFVDWAKEVGIAEWMIRKREMWITELQTGRNPFDSEMLKALRFEVTEYAPLEEEPVIDGLATPAAEHLDSAIPDPAPTSMPVPIPPAGPKVVPRSSM